MKIVLTKPFVVVYYENKEIIVKLTDNKETSVGKGSFGEEFDTEEELNQFIADNELKDYLNLIND